MSNLHEKNKNKTFRYNREESNEKNESVFNYLLIFALIIFLFVLVLTFKETIIDKVITMISTGRSNKP